MADSLRIQEPFTGFPGVAHGGYVGGLLARSLGGDVEVTFRRPVPVDVDLALEREGSKAVLRRGGEVLAEANPGHLDVTLPEPIGVAEAMAASERYLARENHPFPGCFCCGIGRTDDGLRIFVGPVDGREVMAATWVPPPRFADPDGALPPEVVWAALDCPAIWGLMFRFARGAPEQAVTGQMAVQMHGRIEAGQPHVVAAWPLGAEGRRIFGAAAIFGARGEALAVTKQTCVITARGVPLGLWGLKQP